MSSGPKRGYHLVLTSGSKLGVSEVTGGFLLAFPFKFPFADVLFVPLLVLKGIYHYWSFFCFCEKANGSTNQPEKVPQPRPGSSAGHPAGAH